MKLVRGDFPPDPDRADRVAVARLVAAVLAHKHVRRADWHPDDFVAALDHLIVVAGLSPSYVASEMNLSWAVTTALLRNIAELRAQRAKRRALARAFVA